MKIEIKQAIVEFSSKDEYYTLEESGVKPNTVRELTYEQIEQVLKATHIRIRKNNGNACFERKLTNVCAVPSKIIQLHCSDIRQLVIFSWEHPQTQNKSIVTEY